MSSSEGFHLSSLWLQTCHSLISYASDIDHMDQFQIDSEEPAVSEFVIQGNKTLHLFLSTLSIPLNPAACSAVVTDAVRLTGEKFLNFGRSSVFSSRPFEWLITTEFYCVWPA